MALARAVVLRFLILSYMLDLSNSIYHYYLEHFHELPEDKQFHFAARLQLWSRDTAVQSQLESLRTSFSAHGNLEAALAAVVTGVQQAPVFGSKNAAELR